MRVTETTKYSAIARDERFFSSATVQGLKRLAEERLGSMYELTLGDFIALCKGDLSCIRMDEKNPTVLQVYWCKRFADFVNEYTKQLEQFKVPETSAEQQAAASVPKMRFDEALLVFARSYFGLHSFADAERVTLGEILIAKKDTYCDALYRKRLQDIQLKHKG